MGVVPMLSPNAFVTVNQCIHPRWEIFQGGKVFFFSYKRISCIVDTHVS